jgi:GNAT superfamily N-acetyltransferase
MKIRKITAHDTLAISRILHDMEWFTWIQQETVEATQQRVARNLELCQQDDSHTLWVAENEQREVVGYTAVHWLPYLMLKAPEGYVSELFVSTAARGQGVGAQLLETVKAEAIKRGCSRLSLINIKIRESYQRGFYKKQGWTEREHDARFVLELT